MRNPLDPSEVECPYCEQRFSAIPESVAGELAVLRAALTRSMLALDDWLNVEFPDYCEAPRVEEARARVYGNGTVAYIADVQQQNRAALAPMPPAACTARPATMAPDK